MWLFSLLILLIPVFITLGLWIFYRYTKVKLFKISAFGLWILIGFFFLLGIIFNLIYSKTEVTNDDYYGTYIIDRTKFKGKNADWQYNHYRFEITKNNEILLYSTDQNRILKIYKRKIEFVGGSASPHLRIINKNPKFILESEPTLYRNPWNFYLVFKTKPYSNMFFKKGSWESINN